MTAELWKNVNAALDRLAAVPADRRAAELERLRRDQPDVAAEVASLLRTTDPRGADGADRTSTGCGEDAAAARTWSVGDLDDALSWVWRSVPDDPPTDPDATPPEVPGCRLDVGPENVRYGGMGVVYFGTDRALHRPVAVKVLRRRLAGDPVPVARFRDESLIAAQLQHPGIVPVYDVGHLDDGRPYCTMKRVRGDTFADVLKRRPSPAVDLIPNLGIFRRVCEALGYAHGKRIIHRDLKPGNVMVGAFGEVLLVDWGLAKKLGGPAGGEGPSEPLSQGVVVEVRTGELETKSGMGTLAYLAPEQATGRLDEVDERSDVFGLGAILCMILTGQPPYTGRPGASVQTQALEGDLDEANARLGACGADRELIDLARRCLARDRSVRPADGSAVAGLVAGYVAGVEERLRRAEVRTAEQRKRTRVQLALAGAVLLMISGGGALAWHADKRATERNAKEEREEAARRAERDRAEADRRAAEARLTGERDTEKRLKIEQEGQSIRAGLALAADLRKQYKFKVAADALAQAERLADGPPERLAEVRQARRDLALVVVLDDIRYRKRIWIADENGQGHYNSKIAPPEYRTAFADSGLDVTALAPAEAAARVAASAVKADLVAALDDWALYEPDPAVRNRLLEVARRVDPGPWTDRFRDPAVRADQSAVAKLAADADPAGAPPAALSTLSELMVRHGLNPAALLSSARARDPTNFDLAVALGYWRMDAGKAGDQIGPFEAARALRPECYAVCINLGTALRAKGDLDGAIAALREAIRLYPQWAQTYSNLGNALYDKGDFDGAIGAYKEAIERDPRFAIAHTNRGLALDAKGNIDGAIAAHKRAIEIEPNSAATHSNLGQAWLAKNDTDRGLAAYARAIELAERASDHSNLCITLYNRGNALNAKGDSDGAIKDYRRAIALDPKYPEAHCNLGLLLLNRGQLLEAVALLRKGHDLGSRRPGWRNPSAKWVADCEKLLAERGLIAPQPHEVPRPKE